MELSEEAKARIKSDVSWMISQSWDCGDEPGDKPVFNQRSLAGKMACYFEALTAERDAARAELAARPVVESADALALREAWEKASDAGRGVVCGWVPPSVGDRSSDGVYELGLAVRRFCESQPPPTAPSITVAESAEARALREAYSPFKKKSPDALSNLRSWWGGVAFLEALVRFCESQPPSTAKWQDTLRDMTKTAEAALLREKDLHAKLLAAEDERDKLRAQLAEIDATLRRVAPVDAALIARSPLCMIERLAARVAELEAGHRTCDARKSLAQEIAGALRARGHWCPNGDGPDIINAVGMALGKQESRPERAVDRELKHAIETWLRFVLCLSTPVGAETALHRAALAWLSAPLAAAKEDDLAAAIKEDRDRMEAAFERIVPINVRERDGTVEGMERWIRQNLTRHTQPLAKDDEYVRLAVAAAEAQVRYLYEKDSRFRFSNAPERSRLSRSAASEKLDIAFDAFATAYDARQRGDAKKVAPRISPEEQAKRCPPPPETIVGALQDRVTETSWRLLSASPVVKPSDTVDVWLALYGSGGVNAHRSLANAQMASQSATEYVKVTLPVAERVKGGV